MKRVYIILGVLCAAVAVFIACCAGAAQADADTSETLEPLASLKASAIYTEKPDSATAGTTTAEKKPETTAVTTGIPETTGAPTPETTGKPESETASPQTSAPETTASIQTSAPETTAPAQTTASQPPVTKAPETVPVTEPPAPVQTQADTSAAVTTAPPETETQTESAGATASSAETEPPEPEPELLLDFSVLQKVNPDIYAWLEIDGTIMDDPILQNPESDSLYLNTGYDKKKSTAGAIYTESTYNSLDFNDPVTLIYGHKTIKGHMFGALQSTYSDAAGFAEHSDIKIYLPGEVRHYTVFAAVPFESIHILYTYDFSNNYWYKNFFKTVKSVRAIGANFNEDAFPEPGDRVIILSTCLEGDKTRRYLVMAVLQDDLADNGGGITP